MNAPTRDEGVADTSLDRSLVRGIAWTGVVKWTTQIVSWVATLATVRLLAPTDFGLFGMAMVYVGFGQIVTEAGISAVVVQRPGLKDVEARELAGLSVLIGLLFSIATLVVAVPIAKFYSQPTVVTILWALSPVFFIRSFQLVPRALLAREMQFKTVAINDVVEALALVITTLALALMGFTYWALVGGSLAGGIVTTAFLVRRRWVRPAMPTRLIKAPIRFTWQVTVSQVAYYAYTNADFAVVGRALGSVALGGYAFAWNMANIAGERVSAMVGRVTPPLFAAAQNDPPTLRRYLSMVLEGTALLTLPASIGLSLVADEFVPVVAGERWSSAVAPLRILAIYSAFRSIFFLAPQVLIATGRAQTSMRFGLLATLVMLPAFIIGSQWGAVGVAMVWIVVYPVLALSTFVRATLEATGMSWRAYWMAMWPAARATMIMAAAVLAVRQLPADTFSQLWALVIHVLVGAVTYTAVVAYTFRTRLRPMVSKARERLRRRPLKTTPVHTTGTPTGAPRLLLISYHFAPSSAVGALRWQKMVRIGAERGWEFDVIACAPGELRSVDEGRWADMPPGTRVYGVASRPLRLLELTRGLSRFMTGVRRRVQSKDNNQKGRAARLQRTGSIRMETLTWLPQQPRDILRAYFAWLNLSLDGRWARDAARLAQALHQPGVHRAVITSGPPHAAHVAGVTVAKSTGLPLIVDFRDPWSLVQRLPEAIASRAWVAIADDHERAAVRAASLIVTNTAPLCTAMQAKHPGAAKRILAVTNGCDEEALPVSTRDNRFMMAYAGSIYLDRDPRPLFTAIAGAARNLGLTPEVFGVELMGDVAQFDGVSLRDMAEDEGVGHLVTLHPSRPRAEAIEFLSRAAMLVVLPQDSRLAIPAKLFDYMQHDAWIMALTDPQSATGGLLSGTDADVLTPDDVPGVTACIERRYREFRAGGRAVALASNPIFTRRAQADRLFNAIDVVAGMRRQETLELCAAS